MTPRNTLNLQTTTMWNFGPAGRILLVLAICIGPALAHHQRAFILSYCFCSLVAQLKERDFSLLTKNKDLLYHKVQCFSVFFLISFVVLFVRRGKSVDSMGSIKKFIEQTLNPFCTVCTHTLEHGPHSSRKQTLLLPVAIQCHFIQGWKFMDFCLA